MKRALTAAAAGLLFGIGLVMSGMADPRNVIGFLDVRGDWNPTLLAVMAGAIGVHASLLRLLPQARFEGRTARPGGGGIDRRLVIGASIFGVGWGVSGYCPGPAVVALGFGSGGAVVFVATLVAGAAIAEALLAGRAATLDALGSSTATRSR